MFPFLLGAGVGYVLGARAGRERYELIARVYRRIADNPTVQGAAGVARAKAGEAVSTGVAAARERLSPSAPTGRHEPVAPGRMTATGSCNGSNPRRQARIVGR